MNDKKNATASAQKLAATNEAPVAIGAHLLTKSQLAERLGMTVRGVECLVARRKIPVCRLGHRTVRFSWPKVLAALAKLETREV
jgi:excisionase family DNA binding protein